MTCADLGVAEDWVAVLGGRPVPSKARRRLRSELVSAWRADPASARLSLERARADTELLTSGHGLEVAELRSHAAWQEVSGEGPLSSLAEVGNPVASALSVWDRDDDEGLVLTEIDIEGWIYYASLCREVQGAGALRLSVSDRVAVYRAVRRRWAEVDRDGKIAMTGLGAFWEGAKGRWQAADYAHQQAWIQAAPLPPPMTATSLGYITSLLEGPLERHVEVLHGYLGPLGLRSP